MKGRDKTDVRSTSGFLLYVFLPSFFFPFLFFSCSFCSILLHSLLWVEGNREQGASEGRSLCLQHVFEQVGGSAAASCTINLQSTINIYKGQGPSHTTFVF